MVPVTRQHTVLQSATVQGKPHVRASVVDRIDGTVGDVKGQAMSLELHGQTTGGLNIRQRDNTYVSADIRRFFDRLGHRSTLLWRTWEVLNVRRAMALNH